MSTSTGTLAGITWPYIERAIERLVVTAEGLTTDDLAWRPPAADANSIAVLASHTLGNAEDNLLGTLGGVSRSHDRASDFERPEVDAAAIRQRWERLRQAFETDVLPGLTDERLLEKFDHPRRGAMRGLEVLLVVARHAAEHLAHAELTRDLRWASRDTIVAPGEEAGR